MYPARKTCATDFAHMGGVKGLQIQTDAVAYRKLPILSLRGDISRAIMCLYGIV